MAVKKKKKKPSAGLTGRAPFSEPRVMVFSMFGGCSFQMAPYNFDYIFESELSDEPGAQTDLMQNLMVLQNNALIAPNKTIETRQNLTTLFQAPESLQFTGVAELVGHTLYAAMTDGSIRYGGIPASGLGDLSSAVTLDDRDDFTDANEWTCIGYADGKLVGMTSRKQLWTGDINTYRLENARMVPNPPGLLFTNLVAHGTLEIAESESTECPFRVGLSYTRLNKYGPTLPSPRLTFYASKPTSEWSAAAYITVSASVPAGYGISSIELYYTEGEAQEFAFLSRVVTPADGGPWAYNWTGYMFDTNKWSLANLKIPSENFTSGVPASRMASHDGQVYFWGGDPEYRVWIGGNPGNRFSVSTGTGGGFADCEPGTGVKIRDVLKYKTQQGASIMTLLCDSENSQKEYRFNLVENNISLSNEQSVKGWQAEKIAGTVGCKSYNGAVVCADGLYSISRYGLAVTTLTMEYNSQLRVQYLSDPIEPVFLDQYGNQLAVATLFAVNDVLYMTFGSADGALDSVIFCYDIDLGAWWTYTLDIDESILNMVHIDHEDSREGLGVITANAIYLLPTTQNKDKTILPAHEVLIETAELTSMQPQQGMQHLSQLELHFDYFIGELDVDVVYIDQFGRKITTSKHIHYNALKYGLVEHMRLDAVVTSYRISMRGPANMRLTHFLTKSYPKSNRIGMAWGFDSRQTTPTTSLMRGLFGNYNDLRKAIIP